MEMSEVLIVGNVTKDVYLRLDNRQNEFERDQNEVTWLDLAFDGSSHRFYERLAVFGGAAVSLEVLSRFGLSAMVAVNGMKFKDGQLIDIETPEVYRYILCQDNNIAYFSPSNQMAAKWQVPPKPVDWIYVDRSANLSQGLSEQILNYLNTAEGVRLAFFMPKQASGVHIHKLEEQADLLFTEKEDESVTSKECICICQDEIRFDGKQIAWSLKDRQDLMTHLTTNSIIAASILGAVVLGKTTEEALLLARANVENANLSGSLNLTRLEETIVGENYRVENI
jgi:hypothetical protein